MELQLKPAATAYHGIISPNMKKRNNAENIGIDPLITVTLATVENHTLLELKNSLQLFQQIPPTILNS